MNCKIKLLTLLLLTGLVSQAQKKLSIENVYQMSLRNTGPIITNDEVKGYYSFFQSDKVSESTNEYSLQLVDINLNKLKDIKFKDTKSLYLLESAYNGSSMMFMFYNRDNHTLDYRTYDLEGNKTFNYTKALDNKSEQFFKQSTLVSDGEESSNQNLFDIPGRGYIALTPIREGRQYTYTVTFYSSEKRRTWTYNPINEDRYEMAQYLGASDSVVVLEVLSRNRLMSSKMESTLLGVNLFNGRKVFEISTIEGAQQLYPVNLTLRNDKKSFLLMGPYYNANDHVGKDNSEGVGVWEVNNKGKVLRSKYSSFTGDMSKFLSVDRKGRVGDMGYVYFHSLQQTADGKLFAIGEGYKKVADGVGIAATVVTMGRAGAATKLRITDMLLLSFDESLNLLSAEIYDKNNNSFSLGRGSDFVSPHIMAYTAKAMGIFDYSFTQQNSSKTAFTSAYTDYERSKDYKGLTFNTISYYDGKISRDKINMKTAATSLAILPSRTGSVLVIEYFKKEKRLDMHIEKIN